MYAAIAGHLNSFRITCIDVTNDSHARISGENPTQTKFGFDCSVGNNNLSCVKTITHAHSTAVMKAYPGSTACCVQQRIENGPVSYGITSVHHSFGFAVR